ncbi:MAG TPA: hypothetical protein VEJ87_10505 [Acidimicrobiales bacterium]|nr:hypothetical protein [Acidimicrobiales bacterium]
MPRTDTYRQRLWEHALGCFGYVTTQDAIDLEIPPGELPKLAEHGGLEHVAYGLYRFGQMPRAQLDQYAEAVLRVGRDAHLTGDTVLALHELLPLAPRHVRVGVNRRTRARFPKWLDVRQEKVPDADITIYDGIPSTTVARALVECKPYVMRTRLLEAARVAREKGLLTRLEEQEVLEELSETG